METALDIVNGELYTRFGGDKLHRHFPRSLSRKIEFYRECFKKLPGLPEKKRSLGWADDIERMAKDRHWCAHGFFFVDPGVKDAFYVERSVLDHPLKVDDRIVSKGEIMDWGREALKYALLLSVFAKVSLSGEPPPDESNLNSEGAPGISQS